jgi:hypothetical protein
MYRDGKAIICKVKRAVMTERITISIDDSTGEARFLVNGLSACFLDETSVIKRASHVEPVSLMPRLAFYMARAVFGEYGKVTESTRAWSCLWRVNLSPIDGPILPEVYKDRSQAIDAEIAYLEAYFL